MNTAARTLAGRTLTVVVVAASLTALAACGRSSSPPPPAPADPGASTAAAPAQPPADDGAWWTEHVNVRGGTLRYEGDVLRLERDGRIARLTPAGDLAIDGAPVAVDAAQRALLVEHYGAVRSLRTNAVATGREGVALGKQVVGDVIAGLAKGDTSGIEANAKAGAERVKLAAARICDDLAAIDSVEGRVTAAVPAFAPFAFVETGDVEDCRKDLRQPGSATAAAPGAATGTS
jgi:hypothetical protein